MKQLLLISLVILFFAQCKKGDGRMCTEEFRIITVSLENQAGQSIVPDSYYVVIQEPFHDTLITHENTYQTGPLSSEIILLTDNEMVYTNESGHLLKLTAYIDGEQRVNENYLIRNDGCHIELVIGNTTVVISDP
jgi:hypothetical protein